jgi:hypothetical protein
VLPTDYLSSLGFPAAAYPDWEFDLVEEFERKFRIPLSMKALPSNLNTLDDWVKFLATLLRQSAH